MEILSKQYEFSAEDSIVDFGCGKGRFAFYINHFFNSAVTGIEIDNFFYKQAVENRKKYTRTNKNKKDNINFLNCFAESYKVNLPDNKFYFFNPFSLRIFIKVLENILESAKEYERAEDTTRKGIIRMLLLRFQLKTTLPNKMLKLPMN